MARRTIWILFLAVGLVSAASATRVVVQEPPCGPGDTVVGPSALVNGFNPIGPINGGGTFSFCNATGTNWLNLVIAISTDPSITPSDVSCPSYNPSDPTNTAQLAFLICSVTSQSPGNLDVKLFGTSPSPPFPGIPDGNSFVISFDCPNGACAGPQYWPDGTKTRAFPNYYLPNLPTVPEPSSLILLGSGVLAVVARRRRR